MFFRKRTWWLGSGLKEEIAAQHMRWLVWFEMAWCGVGHKLVIRDSDLQRAETVILNRLTCR